MLSYFIFSCLRNGCLSDARSYAGITCFNLDALHIHRTTYIFERLFEYFSNHYWLSQFSLFFLFFSRLYYSTWFTAAMISSTFATDRLLRRIMRMSSLLDSLTARMYNDWMISDLSRHVLPMKGASVVSPAEMWHSHLDSRGILPQCVLCKDAILLCPFSLLS
jgi:hypothetical protein